MYLNHVTLVHCVLYGLHTKFRCIFVIFVIVFLTNNKGPMTLNFQNNKLQRFDSSYFSLLGCCVFDLTLLDLRYNELTYFDYDFYFKIKAGQAGLSSLYILL